MICCKERPWPESHAIVSAGQEIRRKALLSSEYGEVEMPIKEAIEMQSESGLFYEPIQSRCQDICELQLYSKSWRGLLSLWH